MSDIRQTLERWLDVLAAHCFDGRSVLRPPAAPAAVAAAENRAGLGLPASLHDLYAVADGQENHYPARRTDRGWTTPLLPGHDLLPVERALAVHGEWAALMAQNGPDGMAQFAEQITVRAGDVVAREYWTPTWWPLAQDGGGNLLVVDTAPPAGGTVGQIVVAGPDEDERRVLAPGLLAYVEALIATPLQDPAWTDEHPTWDSPTLR